ncbi:MAG: ribbon-helix-helix domain-containing protein [Alphaproteobacteria bacterium]|nr:ribbon-helix-helix domain-containing protein [Alphaproteobacteria bacterium]
MARAKKMVTMTLDPKLVERLDEWIADQQFPPARNAVIEAAVTAFLDQQERKK